MVAAIDVPLLFAALCGLVCSSSQTQVLARLCEIHVSCSLLILCSTEVTSFHWHLFIYIGLDIWHLAICSYLSFDAIAALESVGPDWRGVQTCLCNPSKEIPAGHLDWLLSVEATAADKHTYTVYIPYILYMLYILYIIYILACS